MILFIVRVIITTIVVLICAHFLPGLEVKNNLDAVLFGIILAIINSIIRPILTLLTLPITIFTLGLFLLVINGFTFCSISGTCIIQSGGNNRYRKGPAGCTFF